jgi:hypothetical protein
MDKITISDFMWSTCFSRMICARSHVDVTARHRPAAAAAVAAALTSDFFKILRAMYLRVSLCSTMRTRPKVPVPAHSERTTSRQRSLLVTTTGTKGDARSAAHAH